MDGSTGGEGGRGRGGPHHSYHGLGVLSKAFKWNNKGTQLRRCMLTSDLTVNM